MEIYKFTSEFQELAADFECGNIVIDKFLKDGSALDNNQGITYIMLSDTKDFMIGYYLRKEVGISFVTLYSTEQGYHLYHDRNSYENFEEDMSTFVKDSDISAYKLYKCVDDIVA